MAAKANEFLRPYLGYQDMLTRFFRQQLAARGTVGWGHDTFVLRKHAERDFWRWVCSWSRAFRMPSDLGFDDGPFVLPPLAVRNHDDRLSGKVLEQVSKPSKPDA